MVSSDQLDPQRLPSPEAAGALAGFDVLSPAKVPPGDAFSHAIFDAERRVVTLVYNDFWINETPIAATGNTPGPLDWVPPEAVEAVQVGGAPASYVQGCWTRDAATGPRTWDRSCSNMSLAWQANGMQYHIQANLYIGTAKETLIAIAESFK